MRATRRVLLVAALACGTLAAVAPGAGASAPAANKTCATFDKLTEDLGEVDPSDADAFDQDTFEQVGDAFHKAARTSPRKVKSALNTLGNFYGALGDSDNAADALQVYGKNGAKFSKALTKFSNYVVKNC